MGTWASRVIKDLHLRQMVVGEHPSYFKVVLSRVNRERGHKPEAVKPSLLLR